MEVDATPGRPRGGRAREWFGRYAPAEVAATLGAVLAATMAERFGVAAVTAYAGAIGEALAFYAVLFTRDLRANGTSVPRRRAGARTVRNLVLEFGPAELVDTLVSRPLLMYLGTHLTGRAWLGVILGKIAADIIFYALAIAGYEIRKSVAARAASAALVRAPVRRHDWPSAADRSDDPLAREALDRLPHTTPFLMMDLDRVERSYLTLADGLGVDVIHYAMKCNPDPRVLTALYRLGCHVEVASYTELAQLMQLGIDPADVLYGNPVKPAEHVRLAHAAGCWRFAVDGEPELAKLAEHAPGSAVYVRLRVRPETTSSVPSEGKFGVDTDQAERLLHRAARLGLCPYGLSFHVGSQMTEPAAWADAIAGTAALMERLDRAGLRVQMLDIGGGFPARYADPVPQPSEYGALIRGALDRLPYRPLVVAEPGRALVAEAGVLVATVIGTAVRGDGHWAHLDVGAFNGMMESLETRNTLTYPVSDSRWATDLARYHVTGPTCDSQDTLFFDVPLSAGLTAGDRVYIATAGAYTTAYASRFNGFDIPDTWCFSSRLAAHDLHDHEVEGLQTRRS